MCLYLGYILGVHNQNGVSYSGIIRASGARNQSSILCTPTIFKAGPIVKWYYASFALTKREFDSR